MKNKIKILSMLLVAFVVLISAECLDDEYVKNDQKAEVAKTLRVADNLTTKQPTPTDFDYSLERWLLIKRAYWVNGQRDKARMLPCPIADVPLGYVILFSDNGAILGRFVVEGKVVSLNSFLSPDSEFYEIATGATSTHYNKWLADIDGTYGQNDSGVFFFTPDGKYLEYTGKYLYSDIPFIVSDPVLKIESR